MSPSAEEHNTKSRSFLQAAHTSIRQDDIELAFQFLLKSIVEALRAVASTRDLNLRSDASIWDFGEALAMDLENAGVFSSVYPVARFVSLDSFGGYSFTFGNCRHTWNTFRRGFWNYKPRPPPKYPDDRGRTSQPHLPSSHCFYTDPRLQTEPGGLRGPGLAVHRGRIQVSRAR